RPRRAGPPCRGASAWPLRRSCLTSHDDLADEDVRLPDLGGDGAGLRAAHARLVALVVRHRYDLLDGVWALAKQHGAAHGLGDLAVADHVALLDGEVVLAGARPDLAAAHDLGVEAVLDALEELLLGRVAVDDERVAHPRRRRVGVVLPAAGPGRPVAGHQAAPAVHHVALEHSVLDEHRALGGRALVVVAGRAPGVGDRAVVHVGHGGTGDLLPQLVSEH